MNIWLNNIFNNFGSSGENGTVTYECYIGFTDSVL